MAGFSKGPNPFFRLSPAEPAKAKCFAVQRGEMTGRIDSKYFALRETLAGRYPLIPLGTLVKSEPDYGSGARAIPRTAHDQPRYIRITDFGEDGIEPDHEFVTADPIEPDCFLTADDFLFARSGATVGKTYLHEDTSEHAIFAGYCIRFRFDPSKALPRFVYWWTKTSAYLRWVATIQRPAGQPNINKEEFKSCLIPLPGDTSEQGRLVAAMDAARAARRAKLEQADALLAGLDSFLLQTIGINPTPPQRQVFAVRANDTTDSRFDPDSHSLRFKTIREGIERGRYPSASAEELCQTITTGFAAGRQDQAFDYESGVPHLRPLNLNTFGQLSLEGTKFVPKESVADSDWCVRGEVLFNNTNSTEMVGKSAVFDLEKPCACSNHITRLKPRSGVDAEYLAAVFNALRRIGYLALLSTNFNNQAGINRATLRQLRLPRPPTTKQELISAEVRRRREEARRLRAEGEAGWEAAKRWFEEQILGASTP